MRIKEVHLVLSYLRNLPKGLCSNLSIVLSILQYRIISPGNRFVSKLFISSTQSFLGVNIYSSIYHNVQIVWIFINV
jgi:hypothetical protein